ncbi:arylsulfatase [Mariniphaga sediminis]|uniref:Arylsulfatase n=1 Tax=Mariniphaga sediminis TaxID=1628158 RepID=A0A399D5D6_9BACT|nr:arylsulfatase [Mariniphaga sediminis]RIH67115.1 arylsulfatase [Mariniphaga sediminis]
MRQLKFIILLLLLFFDIVSNAENKRFPNIVYILADDLGYGDVSCLNEDSKLHTPNIDKLASEGILFTDVHTSSSVCTPTRYGILTGRYNWRSRLKKGVLSGYSKSLIEQDRLTVAELLKEKGYLTAYIGKWHLGWDWHFKGGVTEDINSLKSTPEVDFSKPIENGPMSHGFDYSYGFCGSLDMPPYVYVENGVPTMVPTKTTVSVDDKGFWREGLTSDDFNHAGVLQHVTDKAVRYIEEQAGKTSPFFLYLPLPAPHTPILPSSEFIGKSNTNFYGDFVLQVDDVVGQVIGALEKNGLKGNTLIFFTSDNGCSPKANFNELARVGHDPSYIFRGHKADIYEGGHRVPFIVACPSIFKGGRISNEVICTTDFMATCAELVGYAIPDDIAEDSYSMVPVLKGERLNNPLREATVHHSIYGEFAIRQGKWKLIMCPGSGGWSDPKPGKESEGFPDVQLYDLESDPGEENNLQTQFPGKLKELKQLLSSYIINGRSTPGEKQNNESAGGWDQIHWIDLSDKN